MLLLMFGSEFFAFITIFAFTATFLWMTLTLMACMKYCECLVSQLVTFKAVLALIATLHRMDFAQMTCMYRQVELLEIQLLAIWSYIIFSLNNSLLNFTVIDWLTIFLMNNWLSELFMNWRTFVFFFNELFVLLMDEWFGYIMDNFFMSLMNNRLMNLSDVFSMNNRLMVLMNNVLMLLMNNVFMVLMNNILMMLMNDVLMMFFDNRLVHMWFYLGWKNYILYLSTFTVSFEECRFVMSYNSSHFLIGSLYNRNLWFYNMGMSISLSNDRNLLIMGV